MKKDTEKTKVKFYYEKRSNDVFAYFPEMVHHGEMMSCYAHVGQHSACSHAYVEECKPVKRASKYADLKNELESLGYNLEIL